MKGIRLSPDVVRSYNGVRSHNGSEYTHRAALSTVKSIEKEQDDDTIPEARDG